MIPRYSQKAFKAIAYLFQPYNDIDIYVEDDLNRNMYEILIERILGDKAKVKKIFTLGGRNEVLKACANDQKGSRRRLYIIDGDIDLLLAMEKPNLRYLYRLGVYTSENLLLSEKAAVEVSYDNLPNENKSNIKSLIEINQLITEATEKLKPLFVMYGVKHFLEFRDGKHIHIDTVGFKIEKLGDNHIDGIYLSESKIAKRIDEIKNQLMKDYGYSKDIINLTISDVENNLPKETNNLTKYISAKTYLLPLIFHRLQRKAKCSSSKEQLKTRMARFCELNIDPDFSNIILLISQGYDLLGYSQNNISPS